MTNAKRLETELDVIRSVNSAKRKGAGKGFGVRVTDSLNEINGSVRVVDSTPEPEENPAEPEAPEEPAAPTADNAPVVAQPDVSALVQQAVSQIVEPLRTELEQSRQAVQQLQSQLDSAQSDLVQAKKDADVLDGLARLAGTNKQSMASTVNVNTKSSVNDSPKGLAQEFVSILQDSHQSRISYNVADNVTGLRLTQRDPSALNRFIHSCLREEKAKGKSWRDSALVQSLESYFKANGLLQGRVTDAAGPTTGTTAPPLFLDILSSLIRETHAPSNVFWQFPITAYDSSSAPGKVALVPRYLNLTDPTATADFLIADNTTYNAIGLVTGTNSDSQSIDVSSVPIGIAQYGLGRGTAIGTRPVYVPEFFEATSLLPLIDAVEGRLMQNYYRFEDLLIRQEFLKATTVIFNNRGNTTSTALDILPGANATMTKDFVNTVYSQMYAAQIPTLPDGCYILVLNPIAANQLKISLDSMYAAPTPPELEAALNTFRMATGVEIGQMSQYMGQFCNFHCFVSNSIGVGAVNSVTVHTTTFGAGVGATVTNDSFAFGVGAVGRGIASPVEIRAQASPFQLGDAYIWVSREGASAMDVDSASTAPAGQQTRVWRLRTARVPVPTV